MLKNIVKSITVILLLGFSTTVYAETMRSSYYSEGSMTASGQRFNKYAMVAAHRTLPFGTKLRITNPSNGIVVEDVIVLDRGPFIKGRQLDVSLGVAQKLHMIRQGVVTLKVDIISMPEHRSTPKYKHKKHKHKHRHR